MNVEIINDDCLRGLTALKARGVRVNCCVTSPPYFGLRNYGHEGQIGAEPTPAEFVQAMVRVFSEVRDVMTDDGVLWLNLGDSYNSGASGGLTGSKLGGSQESQYERRKARWIGDVSLKPKDLLMIPARVAIALQEDGWYLRAACPWLKRNGMPDSTTSRPTQCIETLFMLTKSRDCYYDAEAVKKVAKWAGDRRAGKGRIESADGKRDGADGTGQESFVAIKDTRLRRTSDWFFESWQGILQDEDGEPTAFVVNTKGYKGAHFATFPPQLIEPCIQSSTSEKGCCPDCGLQCARQVERTAMVIDRSERTHELGRTRSSGTMVSPASAITTGWAPACNCGKEHIPCTVLDPFGGSGTTAEVALKHGRKAILIELNPAYIPLIHQRLGIMPTLEAE